MSEQLPPPDPSSTLPPPAGASPTASPAHQRGAGTRWLRLVAPVGVVAIALGGFAVAQAATDDSGNDSARDLLENTATTSGIPDGTVDDHSAGGGGGVTTGVTFINDAIADGATQTFSAGAAGTVTISRSGTTLTVVATGASAGWTSAVERAAGPEVEVTFTSGTTRVDLEAEIEDGGVRVRVRERSATDPAAPTDPTARTDNSGPGSVNGGHDGVEDDDSGSGSDDTPEIDDDHSGSGSGSDDAPEVDDHAGSGSSGSGSSGSGSSGSGSSGSGSSGSGHGED